MVWVQNSYAEWDYYRNGILVHTFTYTPPSSWEVGTYFKTGTGQHCLTSSNFCYPKWRHFQFGVTSMYDIGQGSGWEVDVDDPQWTNTADLSSWYPFSTVKTLQGIQAFYDNDYAIGSATYPGVAVSGSSSGCDQHSGFKDTGASVGSGLTLWANAGVGCSFQSPTASNFSVTASGSSTSLCDQGEIKVAGFTVQSVNGFSGPVYLSASTSSNYISASITGANVVYTSNGQEYVTVTSGGSVGAGLQVEYSGVSGTLGDGTYTATAIGSSGSLLHSASISVAVTPNTCMGTGGGGGSVAAGTLITLANASQTPVQNLHVGMQLLSYNMTAHSSVNSTVTRFFNVTVDNYMVIMTTTGWPLVVDQNPAQRLYVMFPNGTWTLLPVTELRVGYYLFQTRTQTWVKIISLYYHTGGTYIMYDVYTTSPGDYIANQYLDPLKN